MWLNFSRIFILFAGLFSGLLRYLLKSGKTRNRIPAESTTNKVLITYFPGLFSARKKGLPRESAVRFLYTYVQTRSGGQHVSPLSHLTPQSLPCRLSFPFMNLFALAVLIVIYSEPVKWGLENSAWRQNHSNPFWPSLCTVKLKHWIMFFDTSTIDLIHDTRYLCARPLGLMGQKQCRVVFQGANKIGQYE